MAFGTCRLRVWVGQCGRGPRSPAFRGSALRQAPQAALEDSWQHVPLPRSRAGRVHRPPPKGIGCSWLPGTPGPHRQGEPLGKSVGTLGTQVCSSRVGVHSLARGPGEASVSHTSLLPLPPLSLLPPPLLFPSSPSLPPSFLPSFFPSLLAFFLLHL